MMHLSLNIQYSIFEPFDLELPDFVVLSGVNGAGKTQLLSGILNSSNFVINEDDINITNNERMLRGVLNLDKSQPSSSLQARNLADQIFKILKKTKEQHGTNSDTFTFSLSDSNHAFIIYQVSKLTGKKWYELTLGDIINNYPGREQKEVLKYLNYNTLSERFVSWQLRYFSNYNLRLREEDQKIPADQRKSLTKYDFIELHGPRPWDDFNKLLETSGLPYRVTYPDLYEECVEFSAKVVSTSDSTELDVNELSSGENTILALCMSILNTNSADKLPKLLLLDEVDSNLHPEMINYLLKILINFFIKEKKMKIIMSTHNPTTVAQTPDDSIFLMQREEERIKKVSKDQAIKRLLVGVPSISVYHENRKQVFVESEDDAYFYDLVYRKSRKYFLEYDVTLQFISSGIDSTGSKSTVSKIVNILKDNDRIYGIIDWDSKENGSDKIKVNGLEKRYTLENYIFDPVVLIIFLLYERIIDPSEIDLEEDLKPQEFIILENEKIQKAIEIICTKILDNSDLSQADYSVCEYYGGHVFNISKLYLECDGKTLEAKVKNAYKKLNSFDSKGSGRNSLKREIVNKIYSSHPEVIPMDVIELLEDIAKR